MFYTIYQIINVINNKIYIGKHQTCNLDDGYMGSGTLLKRSQKKYGLKNFKKNILYIFETEHEMNLKEAEIVTEEFCQRDDTFNLCPGGHGGFGYINSNKLRNGFENTLKNPSVRQAALASGNKGRETQKKLWVENGEWAEHIRKSASISTRTRLSVTGGTFKGKTHSAETKKKISEANSKSQKGCRNLQFGTIWITNGIENKKIQNHQSIPKNWYKGRTCK